MEGRLEFLVRAGAMATLAVGLFFAQLMTPQPPQPPASGMQMTAAPVRR